MSQIYTKFVFVAHSDLATGSTVVQSILRDIGALCEFLFGSHKNWDEDFFDLRGAQDIISMYFTKATQDPSIIVGGLSRIHVDPVVHDRLDKLLAFLEGNQDGICANSSLLILGESVLHSRMNLHETRMVLQYHKARPLPATTAVRFTPVYVNGGWHNMFVVRLGAYVLVFVAHLDVAFDHRLRKRVDEFRVNFMQSRLEIPTEEPPVLLRLFAKRETLAMLYYNVKNGGAIFPQLRPGPEVQQREIMSSFWGFFCDASAILKVPGVTEFSVVRDHYRFYAKSEGVHRLYVLLANETVAAENVVMICADIMKNIRLLA